MRRVNARDRFDGMIAENRMPVGSFVSSTDAAITAAASTTGLNFVIIDPEYGPNDTISTANHVRAAEVNRQEGIAPSTPKTYRSQIRSKQVVNLVVAE